MVEISLIVPIYNVAPYVKEFLDSVVNQTFKNFEAVLVDDGSTDGTEAILDEYAQNYNFLKVIHKENGGVVSAWKRGISESNGDYIAFADPDDILVLNALETQYKLMTESGADLLITGITRFENGKRVYMPADNRALEEGIYTGEKLKEIKNNLLGNKDKREYYFLTAKWNKLFKRKIVLDNLNYSRENVIFGDDVCICLSAIYDSNKICYSHTPLYIYRIRDNSLTTVNFNTEQIDDAANLIDSVRTLVSQKGYMNDFVYYNEPSYYIMRLMHKISGLATNKKEKKKLLKTLKNHPLVAEYDLKKAKKQISFKRHFAIWLLKRSMFGLLLSLL